MHIKPQIVCAKIHRDAMEIHAKPVYEHELKLLAAIHGDGKVSRDTTQEHLITQLERPIDAMEEYMRCEAVYGMHPEIRDSVVHHCYGDFEEGRFVKAAGGAVEAPKEEPNAPPLRPAAAARKAEADARRAAGKAAA